MFSSACTAESAGDVAGHEVGGCPRQSSVLAFTVDFNRVVKYMRKENATDGEIRMFLPSWRISCSVSHRDPRATECALASSVCLSLRAFFEAFCRVRA